MTSQQPIVADDPSYGLGFSDQGKVHAFAPQFSALELGASLFRRDRIQPQTVEVVIELSDITDLAILRFAPDAVICRSAPGPEYVGTSSYPHWETYGWVLPDKSTGTPARRARVVLTERASKPDGDDFDMGYLQFTQNP
jgi:hypothetical protein